MYEQTGRLPLYCPFDLVHPPPEARASASQSNGFSLAVVPLQGTGSGGFVRSFERMAPAVPVARSCQATAMGDPRTQSIRHRIAANSARGAATSATWKTT
jgi:hypothetical protein